MYTLESTEAVKSLPSLTSVPIFSPSKSTAFCMRPDWLALKMVISYSPSSGASKNTCTPSPLLLSPSTQPPFATAPPSSSPSSNSSRITASSPMARQIRHKTQHRITKIQRFSIGSPHRIICFYYKAFNKKSKQKSLACNKHTD